MNDRDTIFRQEALEFHVQGRDSASGVVRLGRRWITWSYRVALILMAATLVVTWAIRVEERASGRAVVDGRNGSVAVLLPAAVAADLPHSQGVTVTIPGQGRHPVPVTVVHAQLAEPADVKAAGLTPINQPGILLTGRLPEAALGHSSRQQERLGTEASVTLRSERIVDTLARQFQAMLGNSGMAQ